MSLYKVVKGLECCSNWDSIEDCSECPYLYSPGKCNVSLMKEALAFIDEQQAQNENLEKTNKYLRERLAEETKLKKDGAVKVEIDEEEWKKIFKNFHPPKRSAHNDQRT